MKRKVVSLPITTLCLALSLSAFALPIYANAILETEVGNVMERGTPNEYMQDFDVEITQSKSRVINTIFLSEDQISPLKTAAERAFKETLGIEIPSDFEFECRTLPYEGIQVGLFWTDKKEIPSSNDLLVYKDEKSYSASFHLDDISAPAQLHNISINNGYDIQKLGGLKTQALEALKNQFDSNVPDDYFLSTNVVVVFEDGKDYTDVHLEWSNSNVIDISEEKFASPYRVSFSNVDLSKNTGKVQDLQDMKALFGEVNPTEKFTIAQEATILEAAKKFLNEKEIGFGNLISSVQIGDVMWFTFDSLNKESDRKVVNIYIRPDLKVTGYLY